MQNRDRVVNYIVDWLNDYLSTTPLKGYIVGVSGGVDSALTSTLCAMTEQRIILLNMPIRQTTEEFARSQQQITQLSENYVNVKGLEIDLTETFNHFVEDMPAETAEDQMAMANSRARLRMTTLYAIGQSNGLLVAGTGNKVEDFGVGFYTKYGDGGVDVSPIADLMKSEVYALAEHVNVIPEILNAPPTDGLWGDGRSDEDQIGATYDELEWAMQFSGDKSQLDARSKKVLEIYERLHGANRHKMIPIPVCEIPQEIKE
ncbi:MAG: NAD(+) synthase [Bacteroidota bacterium]